MGSEDLVQHSFLFSLLSTFALSGSRRAMAPENSQSSLSQLSITRSDSNGEDWDSTDNVNTTQANSVAFPVEGKAEEKAPAAATNKANRTLSDLLRLHAEKGTRFACSPEEAGRLADVLGQWINSGSSPYEAEDDFFTHAHSQDDSSLLSNKRRPEGGNLDGSGRPRGQSESIVRLSS